MYLWHSRPGSIQVRSLSSTRRRRAARGIGIHWQLSQDAHQNRASESAAHCHLAATVTVCQHTSANTSRWTSGSVYNTRLSCPQIISTRINGISLILLASGLLPVI